MTIFVLALIIAAVIAVRARFVYTHPYGPHWLCKGTGKNRGSSAKSWGRCRSKRCKSGEVLRPSARLLYAVLSREAR